MSSDKFISLNRGFLRFTLATFFLSCCCSVSLAAKPGANFSSILEKQTRITFQAVKNYVEENPSATDADRAYKWLFETALRDGLESEALEIAETYLKATSDTQSARSLAKQVQCLGLARSGKLEEALAVFDDHLRSVRFRSANATIDFARALATRAQMKNEVSAAREVYERLSGAFFLNSQVKEMCQNKLDKLDLIDKVAPVVSTEDLEGNPFNLSSYEGKVVLVDFWATNCPPCIEEFPKMKDLYADEHERGFEIVGISLDEDRQLVDQFQEKWKLPWPLVLKPSEIRQLRDDFKVRTIPSTYLINQHGKVVRVDIKGQDLRLAVELLLNGAM